MSDKIFYRLAAAVAAVGVVLGGGGILLGVMHAGAGLLSFGVLLTLQIVVSVLTVGICICIVWYAFAFTIAMVTKMLAELHDRYADEFRRLKAKSPAWIASLLLATEAAMLLVDKSFKDHKRETLAVSFSMLIGFWVANQLMTCDERWKRIAGGIFWFVVLAYLPLSIAVYRGLSWPQFVSYLWGLDISVRLFIGAAILSLTLLPLLARRLGAEGT